MAVGGSSTFAGVGWKLMRGPYPPNTTLMDDRMSPPFVHTFDDIEACAGEGALDAALDDFLELQKESNIVEVRQSREETEGGAARVPVGSGGPAATSHETTASPPTFRAGWLVLILVVFLFVVAIAALLLLVTRKKWMKLLGR